MEFQVNDKVIIGDLSKYKGEHYYDKIKDTIGKSGIITRGKGMAGQYQVKVDGDIWYYYESQLKIEEAKGFKVGDEVTVKAVLHRAPQATLGMQGTIKSPGNNGKCYHVDFGKPMGMWAYDDEELELVKKVIEPPKVFSLKEAQKLCIDGVKVTIVDPSSPKNHMIFDGKNFMYYEDGEYDVADYVLRNDEWTLWTEPEPIKESEVTIVLSSKHAAILHDLVNSSSCRDGIVTSDKLESSDEDVNEMLWDVFDKLEEVR